LEIITEGSGRVPEYGSPAVRRRRLAAELRRLRERAGFRGEQVAEQLGWSASKVSRIELHRTGIKQRDLRQLLDLYGVQDERHRESLIALAEESSKSARLDLATASLPEEYAASVIAEAEAQSVWTWDPLIVPGLLQTADYARAVMSGWREMFPVPPGEIDRRVEARLMRQRVLKREPVFTLAAIIDESVLARGVAPAPVMRGQIAHLVRQAQQPNITVQVLTLTGRQSVMTGAFTYMKFAQVHDVPMHDMVIVEHLTGSEQVEDENESYKYFTAFRALADRALPERESLRLLRKYQAEKWPDETPS
jgi:transcriptional regulator with XRE-family HTH domain